LGKKTDWRVEVIYRVKYECRAFPQVLSQMRRTQMRNLERPPILAFYIGFERYKFAISHEPKATGLNLAIGENLAKHRPRQKVLEFVGPSGDVQHLLP
jgi:hypothetical protein